MTSTGIYQGLNDGVRNSSKVLKPPGGGSSDIFGVGPEETSPRRVKNYNQSQLGTTMFGETNAAVMTNGGSETPRAKPDGNPVTGTGYTGDAQNGAPTMNGNANIASEKASSTASAAAAPSSGTAAPAAQPRTRVPPGGFSSGLW